MRTIRVLLLYIDQKSSTITGFFKSKALPHRIKEIEIEIEIDTEAQMQMPKMEGIVKKIFLLY